MAYRQNSPGHNPYTETRYGSPPQQQQQYRSEFSEGYGNYPTAQYDPPHNNASYDPYGNYNAYNNHQPHQTYEQGGYNQHAGDAGYPEDVDRSTPSPEGDPPVPPSKENFASTTAYEHDDRMAQVRPRARPVGSQKSFRSWRADGQENLWTRGSRTRTCGRFFCCTIMITAFLIISILLSLALWVRPPNVIIANPIANTTQPLTLQNGELSFNFGVNITVDNPNFFGVHINKVELDLIYPVDNYPVGGGTQQNIDIKSNSETNFTFPFSLDYNLSNTSGTAVLSDIVAKCGANEDLTVKYNLKLSIRVIMVSISPTISNSFTFQCPVDASELENILGGTLGSLLRRAR